MSKINIILSINIFNYPKGEAEYFKVRYLSEEKIINKLKEYAKYLVFDKTKLTYKYGTLLYLPALLISELYYLVWKRKFMR